MKAWQAVKHGHYRDVLAWGEASDPVCPADGVVIDVAAAALNFPDLLAIAGLYQVKATPPFVPGLEAVGRVVSAGANSRYRVGDRVIANSTGGAFAEKMAVADLYAYPAPDGLSDENAAALFVAYQTSYFALTHRANLAAGETLLVLGGAGGVGTSAIQIGKKLGARVIGAASTEEKRAHCRELGADEVVDSSGEWVSAVNERTGGKGADVIFDPVGGEATIKATSCIAWNGRLVIIGFASGEISSIPANRVLLKNISVVGLHWGNYFAHQPELIAAAHSQLIEWALAGVVVPVVKSVRPMRDLREALALLEERRALGKIVVTRDPG